MRNLTSVLIVLFIAVFLGVFTAVTVAGEQVMDAQAEIMTRPPDPYQQLLDAREAEESSTAITAVAITLFFVVIGIGWYALSQRTTKTLRAIKALNKPVRRAERPRPMQSVSLPEARPLQQT